MLSKHLSTCILVFCALSSNNDSNVLGEEDEEENLIYSLLSETVDKRLIQVMLLLPFSLC